MNFPQGFSCQVARVGLKANQDPELAVLRSDSPCRAAGVFTTNLVQAAPVRFSRQVLRQKAGQVQAVVINSKNANAVTGPQGEDDCRRLVECACPGQVALAMSTGVIGQLMPMDLYLGGLETLQPATPEMLARAMMTTDTYPKLCYREVEGTRWLGVAKGAGMIHPDMATLLAVVVTDADLPQDELQSALLAATDDSFHCITVDGDSSTNDSLLVLANGASATCPAAWRGVLGEILKDLARQVAFDGEGARHKVTLEVEGVCDAAAARRVGRTILTSPLVKTAIAGKDANWGRILAAAGRSGVEFSPQEAALSWNGVALLDRGAPTNPGSDAEKKAVEGAEVRLQLSLGKGEGRATLWSCDLTHDYVSINGDYRS